VFGDGLHLELTRTGREGEETFNQFALMAAGQRGLPVVASNDVRFLSPSDFSAHEARVCISTGRVLDDPKRPREYSDQQYLKSAEEMCALFADIPDAIDNTLALAERCNIEMRLGTYFLPNYPVPDDETLDTWIEDVARWPGRAPGEESAGAGQDPRRVFRAPGVRAQHHHQDGLPGLLPDRGRLHPVGQEPGIPVGPAVVRVPVRWWPMR
jgi:DNA polymerase-3 subunit alpha